MGSHRQHKSSSDVFSFPSKDQDSEFEFGGITPDLPSSKSSPADHLFCNGKLLPHVFPFQPTSPPAYIRRTNSRTSSIGSKDSLFSSRSNSTSSRSSSSGGGSARTSSSDNTERMRAWTTMQTKAMAKTAITREGYLPNRPQPYGNSQRWQFIKQAPVLSREPSHRRKAGATVEVDGSTRQKKVAVEKRRMKPGIGWRFFRSIMSACRECHAMEPSRKTNIKPE